MENGCESGYQSPDEDSAITEIINTTVSRLISECKSCKKKSLDLSRQGLHSIPEQLLELQHIEFLYLEGNEITSLPEHFFDCFPFLKWLDLRNNNLLSIPSFYLGSSKCLQTLLLEDNELTSLPLELGLVRSLQGLNLRNNPLEFPPPEILAKGVKEVSSFLRGILEAKSADVTCTDGQSFFEYSDEDNQESLKKNAKNNKIVKANSFTNGSNASKVFKNFNENRSAQFLNSCINMTQSEKYLLDNYGQPLTEAKIQEKFLEERKLARQKKTLLKQDSIIQGRKDKESVKEWKDEYKKLQAKKMAEKRLKGKIDFEEPVTNAPFAVDEGDFKVLTNQQRIEDNSKKRNKKKPRALSPGSVRALEKARIKQERILKAQVEEHMKLLNERKIEISPNPQQAMEAAKHDLEVALKLQEEIQQRRRELEFFMMPHYIDNASHQKTS